MNKKLKLLKEKTNIKIITIFNLLKESSSELKNSAIYDLVGVIPIGMTASILTITFMKVYGIDHNLLISNELILDSALKSFLASSTVSYALMLMSNGDYSSELKKEIKNLIKNYKELNFENTNQQQNSNKIENREILMNI